MTIGYTKKTEKFGKIPSGVASNDMNVSQSFSVAEEHFSEIGKDLNDANESIDKLKTELKNKIDIAVSDLDPSTSSLPDTITALKNISTNLKSLS